MIQSNSAETHREQLGRLGPWLILICYAAYIALVLHEHEPWTDEAQSWLLARDASIPDLLFKYLRYEGTPGLWHLLLAIPAKLGMSYFSLNVVGALCAFAGVYLLVRYSPFPLWLKALLPFTYFLAYQYAIVARSYCLIAPVLFATAICYRKRDEAYGRFAICILLLAHISLHTTLMAGAIWLFEVGALLKDWRAGNAEKLQTRVIWLGVLSVNFLLIIWQLWPPPDLIIREPYELRISAFIFKNAMAEAFSLPVGLGFVFLFALLPILYVRRTAGLCLVGLALPLALMCFRYYAPWHAGTLLLFVVFAVWIALGRGDSEIRHVSWLKPVLANRAALAALAVVSVIQIREAAIAGWHDYDSPYSGSLAAAEYIRDEGIDRRTVNALDIHSFSILPYFKVNFFANFKNRLPGSFWIWSAENEDQFSLEALTSGRPEFLLVNAKKKALSLGLDNIPGYKSSRAFRGRIIWKADYTQIDTLLLYQRIE
jgi:hypothetical protein